MRSTQGLDRIKTQSFFVALLQMSLTCAAQLRLLVRVTPSRRVSYMTSRGSQLGEKIILFGEVERENLSLLKIDFGKL